MAFEVDLSQIKLKNNKYLWKQSINSIIKFKNNNSWESFQIVDIINPDTLKLLVNYNNKFIEIQATSIKKGQLNSLFKLKTSEFKLKIGLVIHSKKLDLLILNKDRRSYSNGLLRKWYEFECCDCKKKSWKEESALLRGIGCAYCNHSGIKEIGFNDIPTKAPWMIPYFPGGIEEAKKYTPTLMKKLQFICPYCGRLAKNLKTINSLYYTHSIGCPCCKHMSLPELIMYNILELFNIKFHTQLTCSTFEWIGKYRYDFYLPDFNCIIEMHGGQHYLESTFPNITLETQQLTDKIKKELALNNGINYYFEIDSRHCKLIKPIISNCILLKLFKLLNIDVELLNFDTLLDRNSDEYIFTKFKELIKNPYNSRLYIMLTLNINQYKYQCFYGRCNNPPRRKRRKEGKNVTSLVTFK